MTTVHERMAENLLDDVLADTAATQMLNDTVRRFRARKHDEQYVAWIGQTQRDPAYWPLHQVAAYLKVHALLGKGTYAMVKVEVGHTPGPDADRTGNAAKLGAIHERFTAHLDMHQNGADADGVLSWDEPIAVERSTGTSFFDTDGQQYPVCVATALSAASVPLEVGYTLPSRTLMHLKVEGGVAHWPYGDGTLCLLVNMERLGRFYRTDRTADATHGLRRPVPA